jgi:two-component system chemotaxis sensor kinase CheA
MADQEDLQALFAESNREALGALDRDLVRLEAGPQTTALLESLRRSLHTVKGSCSMFGLQTASEVAHALEDLMAAGVKRGRVPPAVIGLCFEGADLLRGLIERHAAAEESDGENQARGFRERLREAQAAIEAPPADGAGPEVRAAAEAVAGAVEELRAEMEGFFDLAALDEALQRLQRLTAAAPEAPAPASIEAGPVAEAPVEEAGPAGAPAERVVRVPEKKIDAFLHQVGELIEVAEVSKYLERRLRQGGITPELQNELYAMTQSLEGNVFSLQDALMEVRRVALAGVFDHLPRLARDTAHELGKEVELALALGEAAIDKSLLDPVESCAVQLVRNAVAHGIEAPAAREAAGKPRRGTITLRAREADRFLNLEVADDGAGLDLERIRRRAVELGAVEPEEAAGLGAEALGDLIFLSGLSTAAGVGMAAGRGVGMDVVAAELRRLGGSAAVRTEAGAGTTISLRVPMDVTLTVESGIIAQTGATRFVVPTAAVAESVNLAPGMVHRIEGRGETLVLRGEVLPLQRIGRLFGIEDAADDPQRGVAVIVQENGARGAFLFDRLLDIQQVVVKTITGIETGEAISGGAILGDGGIGLVLDPPGLLRA